MTRILLAHKIELRPTQEQEQFLKQSVGIARKTWNELLGRFSETKNWSKSNAIEVLKDVKQEFPFFKDVSSRTSRNVIDDLDASYQGFFKKRGGFPKFKKKSHGGSFSVREKEKFDVVGRTLRIERLKARIQMREDLRLKGIPKQCTISYKAGKWFASILVEVEELPYSETSSTRKPSVGVDLGIKDLAILSDGTRFEANQPLRKMLKKLKSLQRKLSRRIKGSNRWKKTLEKIQKLHYYVRCKRQAVLHELSSFLTSNYNRISIEDLNVKGMSKNHRLARAVLDCGFFELRRQLEYKSFLKGCELVIVDRWYPSSQICSDCGHSDGKKELNIREWTCSNCGSTHDRDLNAAINIDGWYERQDPTGLGGSIICTT